MQERRNSGLGGYMQGKIRDWRDTGKEKFGTGGIQERRNSGLEGYRKGEILD